MILGWWYLRTRLEDSLRGGGGSETFATRALSDFLAGRQIDLCEKPAPAQVIERHPLSPDAACFSIREAVTSRLAEALFGEGALLEAEIQVIDGNHWLLRSLARAEAPAFDKAIICPSKMVLERLGM